MRKLLVVDDDPDFRAFVAAVGEQLGYEVFCVGGGDDAAAVQKAVSADVIVIDMVMPGLDGIEVVRQMADDAVKAKLILVSGYSQAFLNAAQAIATTSGVDVVETASKPFTFDRLREMLA